MTTEEGLLTAGAHPRAVLALSGALDFAAAGDAYKRLIACDVPAGAQLRLDLSRLTFMDSNGIRLILKAAELARRRGGGLVVVRPPAPVMRVLELVGLDEQLDFVESRD